MRQQSTIEIYITDNGTGIEHEIINRISNQNEPAIPSSKKNGSGLGLKSAYDCAKLIDASIQLVKSDNSGTTFKVILPLQTDAAASSSKNPEILLIDDSPAVREAWLTFANTHHLNLIAISPSEASPLLNEFPVTIQWAVLDYDMKLPNGTGADLFDPLKKRGVKVALSSGFKLNELPQDARNIQWDAILSKEPQQPDRAPKISSPNNDENTENQPSEIRKLKHNIKNELTPLKTALGHFKNHSKLQDKKSSRYLNLFKSSMAALDELVEKN